MTKHNAKQTGQAAVGGLKINGPAAVGPRSDAAKYLALWKVAVSQNLEPQEFVQARKAAFESPNPNIQMMAAASPERLLRLGVSQNPNPNMYVLAYLRGRADTKGDTEIMEHIRTGERLMERGTATAHSAKKEDHAEGEKVPIIVIAAAQATSEAPRVDIRLD
jgi:hypothetical protein